ncbi:MAG: hypothetical protein R3E12_09745 [Candidatus Eisenbacteria bacterium]
MRPTPARRASRDGNRLSTPVIVDEPLLYAFRFAVGERCHSAHPELARREPGAGAWDSATHAQSEEASTDYPRKVQLQRKVVAKGGCG